MSDRAAEKDRTIPVWLWVLLISMPVFLLLRWLFWWLLCPSYERMSSVEIDRARGLTGERPEPEDDLTRIKGIGPKVSQALQSAGITTFRQLAATEESKLKSILKEANARILDPGTWREQARLAFQGDWQALEEMQHEI